MTRTVTAGETGWVETLNDGCWAKTAFVAEVGETETVFESALPSEVAVNAMFIVSALL